MTINDFLSRFDRKTPTGDQWKVKCPAHPDKTASLAVREGQDGRILLTCHAKCATDAIVQAMHLTMADLFPDKKNGGRREVAAYDYRDEAGAVLCQAVRFEPKDFRQRRPDGNGGWIWNLKGVRRVLYRLPKLKGKEAVVIIEGEKDVDALWNIGIPATCNIGGAGKWRDEYAKQLVAAGTKRIVAIPDNDVPGGQHVDAVAQSCIKAGLTVKALALPDVPEKGDVSDYLTRHSKADLITLLKAAEPYDPLMFAGQVTTARPTAESVTESVALAPLLDAVADFMREYIIVEDEALWMLALWVAHTHAFEACESTPYVHVKSATKESGKTRVLEVLQWFVVRPWFTARVSAAVLIRKIDAEMPTLLLDESDAAFNGEAEYTEALRGALNAGYRRGGRHSMCVGTSANLKPKDFSVFGPKAIAGIGRLPDTVAGRSIPVVMKRRRKDERVVKRYRERDVKAAAEPYRQRLAAWASAAMAQMREARPDMPVGLRDRAEEVLEPLIAIADLAGGIWPERARQVAVALMGTPAADNEAIGVKLLADLRYVFDESGRDALHTKDILHALTNIEEAPWADWRHGKPMTGSAFANVLRDYNIQSAGTIRVAEKTLKGYRRVAFEDAWARYLDFETSHRNNSNESGPQSHVLSRHTPESVTDAKSQVSSMNPGLCYVVTDGTAKGEGERGDSGDGLF